MEYCKKSTDVSNRLHHKGRCVSPALVKYVSAWTCSSTQAGFTISECVCVSVQMVQYADFRKLRLKY